MLIRKCDLCKKRIKNEPITAGVDFLVRKEFCVKCGAPVVKFLKKHKFIESRKDKK